MDYPYSTIWINGREVSITSITSRLATANNDFEKNTFEFIAQWLALTPTFTIHTSGSTGTPKAITVTRNQMMASAKQTQKALGYKAHDTALLCLDPAYIAGKMMLVRSFEASLKIYAVTPSAHVLAQLPEHKTIDFTAMVPYQLNHYLETGNSSAFKNVKLAIIGGAPLNTDAKQHIAEFSTQFYATYGMTETISHIALQPLNGNKASDFFTALPDVTLSLDDRQCLCIQAPYLPEKIITNDLVEFINDRQFKWLGRIDNVINSGGIKIILEKVENQIAQLFDLQRLHYRFFLAGIPDTTWGERLIMVIEGNLSNAQIEALKRLFKEKLSLYEIPKNIHFVEEFILTPTGKINRKKTLQIVTNSI